ncbi:MAG: hypothetical protein ACOYK8_07495 [Alphaproteobacteria bacterium]
MKKLGVEAVLLAIAVLLVLFFPSIAHAGKYCNTPPFYESYKAGIRANETACGGVCPSTPCVNGCSPCCINSLGYVGCYQFGPNSGVSYFANSDSYICNFQLQEDLQERYFCDTWQEMQNYGACWKQGFFREVPELANAPDEVKFAGMQAAMHTAGGPRSSACFCDGDRSKCADGYNHPIASYVRDALRKVKGGGNFSASSTGGGVNIFAMFGPEPDAETVKACKAQWQQTIKLASDVRNNQNTSKAITNITGGPLRTDPKTEKAIYEQNGSPLPPQPKVAANLDPAQQYAVAIGNINPQTLLSNPTGVAQGFLNQSQNAATGDIQKQLQNALTVQTGTQGIKNLFPEIKENQFLSCMTDRLNLQIPFVNILFDPTVLLSFQLPDFNAMLGSINLNMIFNQLLKQMADTACKMIKDKYDSTVAMLQAPVNNLLNMANGLMSLQPNAQAVVANTGNQQIDCANAYVRQLMGFNTQSCNVTFSFGAAPVNKSFDFVTTPGQ